MQRRKYVYIALIAALAIHAVVLAILSFVPAGDGVQAPMTFVEIGSFELPEEPEVQKTLEEIIAERINSEVANLMADANLERTSERRSSMTQSQREQMEAEIRANLKGLEDQVKKELEENREDTEDDQPESISTSKKRTENLDKYEYFGKSYNGQVTAEFSLTGRDGRFIHIPGYKCKAGGTVRVLIEVNQEGSVVSASVDATKSSYTDACLADEALASAYLCKFSAKSAAPKKQSGWIVYRFIPQ